MLLRALGRPQTTIRDPGDRREVPTSWRCGMTTSWSQELKICHWSGNPAHTPAANPLEQPTTGALSPRALRAGTRKTVFFNTAPQVCVQVSRVVAGTQLELSELILNFGGAS